MQRQFFRNQPQFADCRRCGERIPKARHRQHLRECQNSSEANDSSESSHESERRFRFLGARDKNHQTQIQMPRSGRSEEKSGMKACKHCHNKYPFNFIHQHQSFCFKNEKANEFRRQYPSSSDEADQYYVPSSSNQSEEERRQPVARQRESYFHHRPRRQYRLSQTSSEEDQRQKYWRSYHENRITASHDLCIKMLQTTLDGITIVVTTNGINGPVLKRVVYNDRTGQRKQISQHRYLRHYAQHTIDPNQSRNIVRNQQQSNRNILPVSRSLESQLQQAIQRLSLSLNQLQNSLKLQKGLSKEEISLFQKRGYKKCSEQSEKCSICHQDYVEAEQVISLKCFHFFHQSCIVEWLEKKPNCPLCKTKQN